MIKSPIARAAVVATSLVCLSQSIPAMAENMFIGGSVEFVQLYDQGFTVKFRTSGTENPADDCLNTRVYFLEATHGEKLTDRAYEMALMASANNKRLSIVIDRNINGPGGLCEATSGTMLVR